MRHMPVHREAMGEPHSGERDPQSVTCKDNIGVALTVRLLRCARMVSLDLWLDKAQASWPMAEEILTDYDSIFCANTSCVLHVRRGDANVRGSGNWARLADGIIVGRRRLGGVTLCDRCASKVMRGEILVVTKNAA